MTQQLEENESFRQEIGDLREDNIMIKKANAIHEERTEKEREGLLLQLESKSKLILRDNQELREINGHLR